MKILAVAAMGLLVASTSLAFERRDGTYLCKEEYSAGLRYDEKSESWRGAAFNRNESFPVRLQYKDAWKRRGGNNVEYDVDLYDVRIITGTDKYPMPCTNDTVTRGMDGGGNLSCTTRSWEYVGWEYRFNFKTNRFLRVWAVGFYDGDERATPLIVGGTCQRIE